uniref:hypothetical protein n=1 Tax=Alistipes sp. TaxID=1872444 RepID=UPI00405761A2
MNRTLLVRTLEALAEPLGCTFRSAPDGALPTLSGELPMLWLSPPDLRYVEGQKHGRACYAIRLQLLYPEAGDPTTNHLLEDGMERLLLELMTALSESPKVVAVEEISITPQKSRPTPYTGLSMRLEAEVITWF